MTTTVDVDAEKGLPPKSPIAERGGYDRLARFMGEVPDAAIFHRFAHLSAQSLLHYQSELHELDLRLSKLQREDREAAEGTDRRHYQFNSNRLRRSDWVDVKGEEWKNDSRQWDTILEIRELMKEYYAALTLHHQVVNINKPQGSQRQDLLKWMDADRSNVRLTGPDGGIWEDAKLDELLAMRPTSQDGEASTWLVGKFIYLYHFTIGKHLHAAGQADHFHNTVVYYDDGAIRVARSIVRSTQALGACLLPVTGILVLHSLDDMWHRLGTIVGFTAAFSLVLVLFTSATIKDVFAATAAFSAVLVVFVGSTD